MIDQPDSEGEDSSNETVVRHHKASGLRVLHDGGKYRLLDGETEVLSTAVESLAIAEFEELRAERTPHARRRLDAERADGALRGLRNEFFAGRQADARSGNGKGGRGGV